jgi:transcriptional regulator with XRE-family HTH domain
METDTLLNIERPIWKLLPLHPQPQPLESFTSYLLRLAEANRLKSIYEIFTLAGAKNGWQWIHCADFPSPVYTNLAQIAGCTPTQIMMTTFYTLGWNFGYPPHNTPLHRFLQGSRAERLRYCPCCLAEQYTPYYSLLWRFLALPGCLKHSNVLLDQCGHCGSVLPLLSRSSRMAWCEVCQGDLRTCHAIPLSNNEQQVTRIHTHDLESLLQSQQWQGAEAPAKLLGRRFALLRQQKNLSITEMAHLIGKGENVVLDIEYVEKHRKATLQDYMRYAMILGLSLQQIFDTDHIQSYPVPSWFPVKGLPEVQEETILQQIEVATRQLNEQGVPLLQGTVSKKIGISVKGLRQYPRVKTLLNRYRFESSCAKAQKNYQREDELLEIVEQAVVQLELIRKPVTQRRICAIVGITHRWLIVYPRVKAKLLQLAAKRSENVERQKRVKEEMLLELAKRAIQQLVSCHEPVTQQTVSQMIGISREQLKKFSHIRALLQQHHESYPDYKREAQSRGKELVTRVKEAIRQVTSCGEPLTQRRICQIVGLPYIRLERYPYVKTLLDQYQSSKARREKQRTPVLEKELLERMEQAIEQLRKNGEPILPRAVAMSAHLPLQRLDDYPRVKVRLQHILDQYNQR